MNMHALFAAGLEATKQQSINRYIDGEIRNNK
jgi:hypothetical protein